MEVCRPILRNAFSGTWWWCCASISSSSDSQPSSMGSQSSSMMSGERLRDGRELLRARDVLCEGLDDSGRMGWT